MPSSMVDIFQQQRSLHKCYGFRFPWEASELSSSIWLTCFCSQPMKIFRPHSDQTIQKTLVFRQAGFQSVSSPFSARLLLLYQAKTLRARTIPPATQARTRQTLFLLALLGFRELSVRQRKRNFLYLCLMKSNECKLNTFSHFCDNGCSWNLRSLTKVYKQVD